MSDIVLSASVRQNLLSLQSTADLLATTQNRLATGNKVNTALDNPTNYFTAQSLNNRSSDISNLLDGVSNGVQVLQAANTGITSLQKLIDSAKSVANQALQAAVGYSTKSSVTSAVITGATADNLLGTGTGYTNNTVVGSLEDTNATATYTTANAVGVAAAALKTTFTAGTVQGSQVQNDNSTPANITGATQLVGTSGAGSDDLTTAPTAGDTLTVTVGSTVNTVHFYDSGAGPAGATDANNAWIDIGTGSTDTVGDVTTAINTFSGGTSSIATGKITLNSSTTSDFTLGGTGAGLTAFGLAAGAVTRLSSTAAATVTSATTLSGTSTGAAGALNPALADGASFTVNGKTITFSTSSATSLAASGSTINLGTGTVSDVLTAINDVVGSGAATIAAGVISIASGTTTALTIADGSTSGLTALGLGALDGTTTGTAGATPTTAITGTTKLAAAASTTSDGLASAFTTTDTITVNGTTIAFYDSGASGSAGSAANTVYEDLASATVQDVLDDIDTVTGAATHSSVAAGKATVSTGTTSDLVLGGSGLAKLGLSAATTARSGSAPSIDGLTLTIGATGNGTATSLTFGTGTGKVHSLNDLNNALSPNNLLATIDSTGKITISATNDAASSTIGTIAGTATDALKAFNGLVGNAPVQDAAALAVRSNLVDQYNNILDQITTTAQDASYNGIDLLNGDQLKLTFNETGTSTLKIQGVTFDPAGLGLSKLAGGVDFIDNASANTTISSLDKASSALRTEASTLGSNLSIVQIRQDFSKNLINVLQTGASNLTLADTNEEAANSQALSTRQSIAVSALALANQSQQSVLQLLR